MRYLLPLPLIFFGVMFYVGGTVPGLQIPLKSSAAEKNQPKKRHKKEIVYHAVEKPHHPIELVKNDDEIYREEKAFGDPWQEELFYLLKHMEPDRGEMMFQAYVAEMRAYDELMKNNLTLSLNNLSAMNGESGFDNIEEDGRAPASAKDPVELELQHVKKLKSILGEHYELVLEQEKLFNDERSLDNNI